MFKVIIYIKPDFRKFFDNIEKFTYFCHAPAFINILIDAFELRNVDIIDEIKVFHILKEIIYVDEMIDQEMTRAPKQRQVENEISREVLDCIKTKQFYTDNTPVEEEDFVPIVETVSTIKYKGAKSVPVNLNEPKQIIKQAKLF